MQISPDVMSALLRLRVEDDTHVKIEQQLDRKLYLEVNKVLEACGGEWSRKAKAHVFDGGARERIDQAVATGDVTTAKELGFFPTPPELAKRLVDMADVQPGHFVLEPSAGEGALVDEIQARGANVLCIERDLKRQAILRSKWASIHDWTMAVTIIPIDDFMSFEAFDPFDRVVMNPPFYKVGLGDHLDHVQRAYTMLAHGGILVSVLPSSVQFRGDRRHAAFREWCLERGLIEPLPEDSFVASGTRVRTCVARLTR